MNIPYKHISLLIMPTDYCNMNCVYCFNGRKTCTEKKTMPLEILEQIYRITLPYYNEVNILWHGGEPLSMGEEFYHQALELQKKYCPETTRVTNGMQSNLTLLTPESAKFFAENNFHIGGSYDGTRNDLTRHNSAKILEGIGILKETFGHAGVLSVVSRTNIDCLIEDYEWFKAQGINYSLNVYLSENQTDSDPLFLPAEEYTSKMTALYDHWLHDTSCSIDIRYFKLFFQYFFTGKATLCNYSSCLGKWMGIHYNGDIYPCNRDFPEKYCYGNVMDYKCIKDAFDSEGFTRILTKSIKRRTLCQSCEAYGFCKGGCSNSALMSGNMAKNHGYFCQTLLPIYLYIRDSIESLRERSIEDLKREINPYAVQIIEESLTTEEKD